VLEAATIMKILLEKTEIPTKKMGGGGEEECFYEYHLADTVRVC